MGPARTAVVTAWLMLGCVAAGNAFAQNVGATLQGQITDEQHGVLPGVSVTITNVETGISRTAITDGGGWYRAPALPPGTYEMTADLSGFVTHRRSGLTLTTGQEPRIDITLQVASAAGTEVTVTVEPDALLAGPAHGATGPPSRQSPEAISSTWYAWVAPMTSIVTLSPGFLPMRERPRGVW